MKNSKSESYAKAGVDITAGYKAVELMKTHIAKTLTKGVCSDVGGFGGLFELDIEGIEKPVLVSGTDGVGTKLKLAFILGMIIELVDTLRGKPTATSEIIGNAPTLKEFVNSEKFFEGWTKFKNFLKPEYRPGPLLEDSGMYNKDGSLKTNTSNNATVIINAGSADAQQVANLVHSTISNMFNNYEEVYA